MGPCDLRMRKEGKKEGRALVSKTKFSFRNLRARFAPPTMAPPRWAVMNHEFLRCLKWLKSLENGRPHAQNSNFFLTDKRPITDPKEHENSTESTFFYPFFTCFENG
jgi:hypothetical protein